MAKCLYSRSHKYSSFGASHCLERVLQHVRQTTKKARSAAISQTVLNSLKDEFFSATTSELARPDFERPGIPAGQ